MPKLPEMPVTTRIVISWYTFRLGNPERNKPSFVPHGILGSQLATRQVAFLDQEVFPLWLVCLFRMLQVSLIYIYIYNLIVEWVGSEKDTIIDL